MSETVPGLGLFLVFKDLTEHKTMILTHRKCRLIINMTILAHAMKNSLIDKLLISCLIIQIEEMYKQRMLQTM